MNKIINIEVPVYNRDDVFNKCFLKGLKYLIPLKDYISLSILFNGPNITQELVDNSIKTINKLGIELYYKHREYNTEDKLNNDIVQIREEVHRINPNFTPLILQLDDDIEILSTKYGRTLLACAQFMLDNPQAGIICMDKGYVNQKEDELTNFSIQHRTYTAGGLLLKNIKEWNSLYSPDAQQLSGSWSDILVSFVRMKEGLGCFLAPCLQFNHYEIRQKTNRSPGFSAHQWGQFYRQKNSSVIWLKHNGVGSSGTVSQEILNKLWKPIKSFNFKQLAIEQLQYNLLSYIKETKLLSIEIPSCNRNNALFKYFLPSLKYLQKLKDKIVICMNYNGGITEEQVAAANKSIKELGFEYYWTVNKYSFEKGKVPTIQFREDAHSLYSYSKYCLILDDDIEFVSEKYADDILLGLDRLENNDNLGAICFCKPKRGERKEFGKFYQLPEKTHAWMDGGILLRNIKSWSGLFPEELRHLYGTGEDRLCLTVRAQQGLIIDNYYSNNVKHWEHHDQSFKPGKDIYQWDGLWNDKNSILNYFSTLGFGRERWVYMNSSMKKSKILKNKRILNIELPVCDKDVFFKRLFLSLKYLKPIAEYCYFVINYQKDFTKRNMKLINRYLTNLGFEVISTYSEYNFDETNHSIMKIRNDTHMLKPNTPFTLSIDSDMKILNENYSKEILGMLYWMLKNKDIGTIGLENDFYHWPEGFKDKKLSQSYLIVPTNMYEHIFATGQGLLLRNILDWNNYLVPGFLSQKIGRHQDTIVVFERCMLGLTCCCAETKNATTILDSKGNRGKFLYGWEDTVKDINSIDTYLKPYRLPTKSDRFHLEYFPTNIQHAPDNQNLKFDFSKYSILKLKNMINEELNNE